MGYAHPRELESYTDDELREWVRAFEERRYGGWRNHDGLWRKTLGLDNTRGKHILDFGCGFGIEALQFAKLGNRVTLIDLTDEGLAAAKRVLAVHGYQADTRKSRAPFPKADIFYSNGVLHHTPRLPQIMARAAKACPEARLLLYSDRAWTQRINDTPGEANHVRFVRAMDSVGSYADWYTRDKLAAATPDWKITRCTYITPDGSYLTATLRVKNQLEVATPMSQLSRAEVALSTAICALDECAERDLLRSAELPDDLDVGYHAELVDEADLNPPLTTEELEAAVNLLGVCSRNYVLQ